MLTGPRDCPECGHPQSSHDGWGGPSGCTLTDHGVALRLHRAAADLAATLARDVATRPTSDTGGPLVDRRSRQTGARVQLWRADAYGLDPADGGPWVTVCVDHGNNVQHDTRADALGWLTSPATWCVGCQAGRP